MLELADGSCVMFDACSAPQTAQQPPLYQLMPPDSLLLLRTRAEGSTSPYQLLKSGPSNASLVSASQLAGSSRPFRSPLMDVPPTLLARVRLLLSNGSEPHVNLTFAMDSGKQVADEGAWFSKAKLQASFRWSLETLQGHSYNKFSAAGLVLEDKTLRFYIATSYGPVGSTNCEGLQGYIVVVELSLIHI